MRGVSSPNFRKVTWNIGASIIYSFFLTLILFFTSLIIKLLYPQTYISFSPLYSLIKTPVEGVIQIIVLLGLSSFSYSANVKILEKQLKEMRFLSILSCIFFLFLSSIPYFISPEYAQTTIGIILLFNIVNGIVSGSITSFISK